VYRSTKNALSKKKGKKQMIYDYIIVGGGISGLYNGYKLQKQNPKTSFLILEKNAEMGGRTNTSFFGGTEIVEAAHVGRHGKDTLLYNLIQELNIAHKLFTVQYHYTPDFNHADPNFIINTTIYLQEQYIKHMHEALEKKESFNFPTFKKFATRILGPEKYNYFIHATGYTDYQKEDAHEVLFYYGMEDNKEGWTAIKLSWDKLHETLTHAIGMNHIKPKHTALQVNMIQKTSDPLFEIIVLNDHKKEQIFTAKNIIFALPMNAYNSILKNSPTLQTVLEPIEYIVPQNFLRVYGQFKHRVRELLKQYIPHHSIVFSPLHYIIPMDADKGVYLLACSDNDDADMLSAYCKNNEKNHAYFEQEIEKNFHMPTGSLKASLEKIQCFNWEEGTHYLLPPHSKDIIPHFMQEKDVRKALYKYKMNQLVKTRYPHSNIFLVGEAVSDNRGWVEEALNSVEYMLSNLQKKVS